MKKYNVIIKQKGLKKSWLAEKLMISPASLSMYLSEKRQMPYELEARLKSLLN